MGDYLMNSHSTQQTRPKNNFNRFEVAFCSCEARSREISATERERERENRERL